MEQLLTHKYKIKKTYACSGGRRVTAKTSGLSLIELMVAMAIMTIGMVGILPLFVLSTYTNNKNSRDTTGTALAQTILEHISAQNPNVGTVAITDCAGNTINISTADGAAPAGAGAPLDSNPSSPTYGLINWAAAQVPLYSATFTDCDPNGHQQTYALRWNVMTITPNTTKLITVSAQQTTAVANGLRFSIPVTLRGIGGPNP
jgi:prepilin-type N-terminal cleavage/methylation domain-containing protein